MGTRRISVDYLVVGSGAAGMAFTDALLTHAPQAEVALVDRRHAPGGHWNDAYAFCRLHQASAFYGVDSLPLGDDTIDATGLNRGSHERATAAEIRGYYQRVLDHQLLPTGRLRYLPMSEHVGGGTIVSRVTGTRTDVEVRRRVVDAHHLAPTIPATTPPPFEVAPDAMCITVNELTELARPGAGYVVIGGGKTAMDAIIWLLDQAIDPDDIQWIKPREQWLTNREYYAPLDRAWTGVESASHYAEAAARAETLDDFYAALRDQEVLVQVDEEVAPTMAHAPTINHLELEQLRRVRDVVRLGRVRRITADVIELDQGTVPTHRDRVHVHCAASGAPRRPTRPVFTDDEITLQPIRWNQPCLSAAVTGYLEATRDDLEEKNRLCPPHAYADTPLEWAATVLHSMKLDMVWGADPDVEAYTYGTRLNPVRGWKDQLGEPRVDAAIQRLLANLEGGVANLESLTGAVRGA
ncbi:MAG: NAD(P)-binding protein [Actinomycetes bacterium]